jgi:hypothetical protein
MKHLSRQRRNFRLFTAVLTALMITSAALFNACSKQETSKPVGSSEQPELTSADQLVLNKIKSFKQRMSYVHEHPVYKSGETMSVDSAKWYLDAVFNYSYAYTELSFESFNRGTFTLTLEKNGDRIDFEEVCEAFNELKQQTLLIYYDTEGEEKELYVSSMSILDDTGNEVLIEVSATIGTDGNNTPEPPGFSQWGPFEEGDDWMYGEFLGDCDGNYHWVKDAATEITWATDYYRDKYIQDEGPGWYAYYTEPSAEADVAVYNAPEDMKNLLRNPNDATIDNDRDYLIHYQKKDVANNLLIETCINWEDMNFYYHGTRKVIYQIIQENYDVFGISDDLTFYSCQIMGKGEGDVEVPNYAYHIVSPLYKTRHISVIDERTSIGENE